jgi:hypothetical protein
MAEITADKNDGPVAEPERHAFCLLAAAELGRWPSWAGPTNAASLRSRVELLASTFDIAPRSEFDRLDLVIEAWVDAHPGEEVVSAGELRSIARRTLKYVGANLPVSNGFQRAAAITKLGVAADPSAPPFAEARGFSDLEAQRQCTIGLGAWLEQVATKPRWKLLPSVAPGETAMEVDKVYVDLFAISDSDASQGERPESDGAQRVPRRLLAAEYPVVSAATMVTRSLERCIVLGEPGSGKSTLVQWIARAIQQGRVPDYDLAVVVKLSAYAAALAAQPTLSLVEFFFETLQTAIHDWSPAAYWLRRVGAERHRCLLVLDGWDEVPIPQREAVRDRIDRESPYFVTVITSRPAGMYRELRAAGKTDCYHIAGLTPEAVENLTANLLNGLGRPDLIAEVRGRIEGDPNLREMAANPFLLGLLVRVLARCADNHGAAPRTLADVYHQVTAWMREQHAAGDASGASLTADHLAGLRRLSYGLLFETIAPRYLFRGQELTDSLRAAAEPVFRSRFVNRVDPVFDEFVFLHATFQEYLAAMHGASLAGERLTHFLDHAFASASRLIVLEFVAGIDGPAGEQCRRQAVQWLAEQDRFLQVAIKLARLAVAGRWSTGASQGFVQSLCDELWRHIESETDMSLTKAAVQAFAEINPRELCRRARAARVIDNWALNCMHDALPPAVLRQERIIDLLPGAWQDFAGSDLRDEMSDAELAAKRRLIVAPETPEEDRWEAIAFAGAVRDVAAAPLLLALLNDARAPLRLREQSIDSLGAIGGRASIDALIQIVTDQLPITIEGRRMAATVLRHTIGSLKALDPGGRDQLLRRMAAINPAEPCVEYILMALEGYPIRDGSETVVEIARDVSLQPEIRSRAITVLASTLDRRLAEEALLTIEEERSGEVVDALLQLAVARSLPTPLRWLEHKIQSSRSRVSVKRLLKTLLQALPASVGKQPNEAHDVFHRLLTRAIRGDGDGDYAREMSLAFSQTEWGDRWRPAEESLDLARGVLARFAVAPANEPTDRVLLATRMVARFRDISIKVEVLRAFEAALKMPADGTDAKSAERLALALADALADIAPGELLRFAMDCEPVHVTLRSRAVRNGWLVFADRIVDAEGREICRSGAEVQPSPKAGVPESLEEVVGQLPPAERRVFLSYWLMVGPGGPCRPGDSRAAIYRAASALLDERVEDRWDNLDRKANAEDPVDRRRNQLALRVQELFGDEPIPKNDAWRQALKRVCARLKKRPEFLPELRRLGLLR